jgi:hypothetical protein
MPVVTPLDDHTRGEFGPALDVGLLWIFATESR